MREMGSVLEAIAMYWKGWEDATERIDEEDRQAMLAWDGTPTGRRIRARRIRI
jgi:hypothetical protein